MTDVRLEGTGAHLDEYLKGPTMKNMARVASVAAALTAAVACSADAGTLKPVAGDLDCVFFPVMVRASFKAGSSSQPAPLSNRAMVGTARGRGGQEPAVRSHCR